MVSRGDDEVREDELEGETDPNLGRAGALGSRSDGPGERPRRPLTREAPRDLSHWVPRILAPLAFFLAATVLVLLVQNALSHEPVESAGTEPAATTQTGTIPATGTTPANRPNRRFYRIREGDTLEAIAARFDTTVDELLMLNPGVDANALSPGRRIRVR